MSGRRRTRLMRRHCSIDADGAFEFALRSRRINWYYLIDFVCVITSYAVNFFFNASSMSLGREIADLIFANFIRHSST